MQNILKLLKYVERSFCLRLAKLFVSYIEDGQCGMFDER